MPTQQEILEERLESVPNCQCTMCKTFPVTQEEFDSLHPEKD